MGKRKPYSSVVQTQLSWLACINNPSTELMQRTLKKCSGPPKIKRHESKRKTVRSKWSRKEDKRGNWGKYDKSALHTKLCNNKL